MKAFVNKASNTASIFTTSDTEPGTAYLVLFDGETEQATCSCPHYRFRREECKHIRRTISILREALNVAEFSVQLHRNDGQVVTEQQSQDYVTKLTLDGLQPGEQVIIRRVK